MKNYSGPISGFAGDDVLVRSVRNTSSLQLSECPHAAHCCPVRIGLDPGVARSDPAEGRASEIVAAEFPATPKLP